MVMQDSEGFLWYATEGGGLCRDDGRQISVFRSDAEHPDILGSNDVASLAEAGGRYILIGTFHGAFVLDKLDYSIHKLSEVDDNKVDDIIVSRKNGHWWLTANKKFFEYSPEGNWLHTYKAGDKYIARMHEDRQGRLWASEWFGELLRFSEGRFVAASWPVDVAPTSIDEDSCGNTLLIGTLGRGVVRYDPENSDVEMTDPRDSVCMSRVSKDLQGNLLVVDGSGKCYVLSKNVPPSWYDGIILTRQVADSVRNSCGLSTRPTALAYSIDSILWFSTGKDIRRISHEGEEVVLDDTRDVSAMIFTKDNTLWLATIFGTVMTYKDGQLSNDDYASNEYGDAVVSLQTDSAGRIVIVCDRYVRLYDPINKTLRQQNIEDDGVYRLELQETLPGKRWSQPEEEIIERMPQWVWWLLVALFVILSVLIGYIWFLHRQRKRFMDAMKRLPTEEQEANNKEFVKNIVQTEVRADNPIKDEWLQKTIAIVEKNIGDEHYSVEQLSADMCMSRMTFYRKIKTVTGQKPTEFIRTIRLRRAAELLRQGHLTVTEVSFATGFSSVSYFSRSFRTMFGVPPTLFGKTTTAELFSPKDMPILDNVVR